jgi:KUP system potassium uptake protein
MVMCVALVLGFKASGNLAAAYGIAVTGTMSITSVLFYAVARRRWHWSRLRAGLLVALFLLFDLAFFASSFAKIAHGGWVPLAVTAAVFTVMVTWKRGRAMLAERVASGALPWEAFMADVELSRPHRVPGTAVFLTSTRRGTPNVLLHHFKHNKVLHDQVVILSVVTDDVPEVLGKGAVRYKSFGHGFWAVTAHFGFMQSPDVLEALRRCRPAGLRLNLADTSYYLGRETLLPVPGGGMSQWRKRLFRLLSRNARSATDFFNIPPNRVVEIGTHIEL